MLLAMAMVKHSGWHGHRAPVTYSMSISSTKIKLAAFSSNKAAIEQACMEGTSDQTQNLQTLQNQLMELGHFQSTKTAITAPQMVHISVVTGERLFDVTPLLAGSRPHRFQSVGGILPAEAKAAVASSSDVSTSAPLNCDVCVCQSSGMVLYHR